MRTKLYYFDIINLKTKDMKNYLKVFWVLFPGSFSLLTRLSLSLISDVKWTPVIFYSIVCTLLMLVLCYKNSKAVSSVSNGLIVAGTCFAYAVTVGNDSLYQSLFITIGLIVFLFTYFFVWFPAIMQKK